MKLTKIQNKLSDLIHYSISFKSSNKIAYSTTFDIKRKITNEIRIPNLESIERMQIRTLNNLKNEIN